MLAQWIGDLVGQMHRSGVTKTQLAEELGVTREYLSMILNGKCNPSGAQERLENALNNILRSRMSVEGEL